MTARSCVTPHFVKSFVDRKRQEDSSKIYQNVKNYTSDSVPSLDNISILQPFLETYTNLNVSHIYRDCDNLVREPPNKKRRPLFGTAIDSSGSDSGHPGSSSSSNTSGGGDPYNMRNGIPDISQVTVIEILELIFYALSIISDEKQNFEDHQADMLMRMNMANIKNLFKESVLEHFEYLKKTFSKYGLQRLYNLLKDLILLARRRGGKTSTMCALIAVIMAIIPNQNLLFFSTGERISSMGRDKIIEFLDTLVHSQKTKKFGNVKYRTRKETLLVKNIFGTWNRANFYPANEEVCISLSYIISICTCTHTKWMNGQSKR